MSLMEAGLARVRHRVSCSGHNMTGIMYAHVTAIESHITFHTLKLAEGWQPVPWDDRLATARR